MEPLATIEEFKNFYEPRNGYQYFYSEFPWLLNEGYVLPISFDTLQRFAISDLSSKNQSQSISQLYNYEELFNYFLYNYKHTPFSTQPNLNAGMSGLIKNIPEGLATTTTQFKSVITAPFNFIKENINTFLIILAVLLIAFVYLKTK